MKRFLFLILILLLLTVPVLAADGSDEIVDPMAAPTDGDSVIKGLLSGWGGTSAPTYYTSSWFWEVLESVRSSNKLQNDLVSGWGYSATSNIFSNPSGYNSSWYTSVLKGFSLISNDTDGIFDSILDIQVDVGSIESYSFLIKSFLESIDSSVGFIESDVNDLNTNVNSIWSNVGLYLPKLDPLHTNVISLDSTTQSIDTTTKSININFSDFVDLWTSDNVTNSNSNSGFGLLTSLRDVLASEEDQALAETTRDEVVSITNSFAEYSFSADHSRIYSFWSILPEWLYTDDLYDDPRYLFDAQAELFLPWLTEANNYFQSDAAAVATFSLDDPVSVRPETPYLDEWNSQLADLFRGLD